MTGYKLGDIVLVSFPFTNLTQAKKRPALIFFDSNDNDIVACRITSQICTTKYDVAILNWIECGLLAPSWIRLHKIATIEKTRINKALGKLKPADLTTVKEAIHKLLKL